MITKEILETKRDELARELQERQQQIQAMQDQINCCLGALQLIDFLIKKDQEG